MRATEQIQQTPEVRPDRRQTTRFARQRSQLVVLTAYRIRSTRSALAQDARRSDSRVRMTRHPGNVGYNSKGDVPERPSAAAGGDSSSREDEA